MEPIIIYRQLGQVERENIEFALVCGFTGILYKSPKYSLRLLCEAKLGCRIEIDNKVYLANTENTSGAINVYNYLLRMFYKGILIGKDFI